MEFKETHHYFPAISAPYRLDEYAKYTPFRAEYICDDYRQVNALRMHPDICEYTCVRARDSIVYADKVGDARILIKLLRVFIITNPDYYEIGDNIIYSKRIRDFYELINFASEQNDFTTAVFYIGMIKTLIAANLSYCTLEQMYKEHGYYKDIMHFCIANGFIDVDMHELTYKMLNEGIIMSDFQLQEFQIDEPENCDCMAKNHEILKRANRAIDAGDAETLLAILLKKPALRHYIKKSTNSAILDAIEEHKKYLFAYFAKPYKFR